LRCEFIADAGAQPLNRKLSAVSNAINDFFRRDKQRNLRPPMTLSL
jgi:hypothetical protein